MKPSGIVTFLFTDIEGSTKLVQDFPELYPEALKRHNAILHKAIESNNGFVFKTVGDAFCSAFQNVEEAISAAYDIQKCLTKEKWDEITIRIRTGIHSGYAEWNGEDYMGHLTLARTSRIMAAANGEQILISNDAYELAIEKFDDTKQPARHTFQQSKSPELGGRHLNENVGREVSFRDMGDRRLKDITQPVKLYQINAHGLREDFLPLKTLDARPNNLPVQLSSFIGREEEMKKIKYLLNQSRLVTLLGTGGAGKTRLAMQVGADMIDEFANGVFIVELAVVSVPSLILQALMNSLGVKEEPGKSPEDTITDYLKDKEIILIMDNCEHLINECANLAEMLLSKCFKLKIIATSREAMDCSAEQIYRIPSLSLPDTSVINSPEKLSQYESVRLFIERALSVNQNFRVTNNNAPALAEVCNRLDGIPLAIELAAARTKVLTIEKIYERLNDRFKLLTGGKRTALPRQQTLRALIDWSHDLLSEQEKMLWRRLSVFAGGWTLESAEDICTDAKISEVEILDLLNQLAMKSIIIFDEVNERYKMLETLKQYGEEKLKESNESEDLFSKHLQHFMELSEEAEPNLKGNEGQLWLEKLESEHSNLQFAIERSLRGSDNEKGLRVAGALTYFWNIRGHYSTGIRLSESVLKNVKKTDRSAYGKVLRCIGLLSISIGQYERAMSFFNESLALFREMGEKHGIANSLYGLGNVASFSGNYEQAQKFYEESLSIRREIGEKSGIAYSLYGLGNIASGRGNFDQAQKFYEENLSIRREIGEKRGIAYALFGLGNVASECENYELTWKIYEECLALFREMGDKSGIANSLLGMGNVESERGNYEQSWKIYEEGLTLFREIGDKRGIAYSLYSLGNVASDRGNYEQAQKFYEESLSIRNEIGEKHGIAESLYGLGYIAFNIGNYELAQKFYEESLSVRREIGEKHGIAESLYGLGKVAIEQGNYEQAQKFFDESLSIRRKIGEKRGIVKNLIGLAAILIVGNHLSRAVKLLGAVKSTELVHHRTELSLHQQIINELHEKLSDEDFEKYFEEGKKLTLEQAISMINEQ